MEKRCCKIENYTFWTDSKYNYTIHGQHLDDICIGGKRHTNQYRWNPKYSTYIDGKYNTECSQDIVMRAFIALYPDVEKYFTVYENLHNKKKETTQMNTTITNNATVNILIKALREQADMYEKQLQQQAEMNKANIENIIAMATATQDVQDVQEKEENNPTLTITNDGMPTQNDDDLALKNNCDDTKEDLTQIFDNIVLGNIHEGGVEANND